MLLTCLLFKSWFLSLIHCKSCNPLECKFHMDSDFCPLFTALSPVLNSDKPARVHAFIKHLLSWWNFGGYHLLFMKLLWLSAHNTFRHFVFPSHFMVAAVVLSVMQVFSDFSHCFFSSCVYVGFWSVSTINQVNSQIKSVGAGKRNYSQLL